MPSFTSFDYYFQTDVVGIKDSTLSLLGVLAYLGSLVSTQLYNSYFKEWDAQTLLKLVAVF